MTALFAGIALGLVGSPHCGVMCGPLALWAHGRVTAGQWMAAVKYHGMRIGTYALLGLAAGQTGRLAIGAGLGRALAVLVVIVLLIQVAVALDLVSRLPRMSRMSRVPRVLSAWPARVSGAAGRWLQARGLAGPLTMGAVTGLLPCGLLYGAVAGATGLANPFESVVFMTAFGVGTVTVLATVAWSGGRMNGLLPARARRLAPYALIVLAALIAARGFGALPHRAHDAAAQTSTPVAARGHVH